LEQFLPVLPIDAIFWHLDPGDLEFAVILYEREGLFFLDCKKLPLS
jgi:hypothetical protein